MEQATLESCGTDKELTQDSQVRKKDVPSTNTIPVLQKTVALLQAVAAAPDGMTAKSLSISLHIPPATCYRIIRTLVQNNWLRENGRGDFQLGFGLAHLARSYAEIEHHLNLLEPALRDLAAKTGLFAKISMREGHRVVTVMGAEPPRLNAISSPVGTSFHLAIGSAGAVLLSTLRQLEVDDIFQAAPPDTWKRRTPEEALKRVAEARKTGIALELGLQHPSIYAMSVPFNLTDSLIAALSLVGWPENFEGDLPSKLEKHLRASAKIFSQIIKASEGSGELGK